MTWWQNCSWKSYNSTRGLCVQCKLCTLYVQSTVMIIRKYLLIYWSFTNYHSQSCIIPFATPDMILNRKLHKCIDVDIIHNEYKYFQISSLELLDRIKLSFYDQSLWLELLHVSSLSTNWLTEKMRIAGLEVTQQLPQSQQKFHVCNVPLAFHTTGFHYLNPLVNKIYQLISSVEGNYESLT